ncbi:MsnO8 family LLM class oxidoreductase [uncultured Corynebacterium sp.]|uniref:MsnO8 family LLM class oxidoreductase n=1 Tax=uncultured Corynebacterium sp. TaxID=159447 RepID=UPI0025D7DA60|nr:MsnO8 family LLM class oxidoreductase [uncultured Corynebacterium sp.]
MRYSLVELGPVRQGSGKHDALEAALAAATEAERLGYHRIWYAEHHNSSTFASQDPVSLIALAARETSTIRVGSGAVLLNHYSPFSVAERFLQLEALFPGRIDLGLGRATGGPVVDAALQRDRSSQRVDDYAQQVQEILAYYYDAFAVNHPFVSIEMATGVPGRPQVWVLGSSGSSAGFAGQLGLGYVFAGFINPRTAEDALAAHRSQFTASAFGPSEREAILALNMVGGATEEEARRRTWPARLMHRRLRSGQEPWVSTVAEAEAQLPLTDRMLSGHVGASGIPMQVCGTVESLRSQVQELVERTGATEVMVQDMLVDAGERSESRAVIAEALAGVDAG